MTENLPPGIKLVKAKPDPTKRISWLTLAARMKIGEAYELEDLNHAIALKRALRQLKRVNTMSTDTNSHGGKVYRVYRHE